MGKKGKKKGASGKTGEPTPPSNRPIEAVPPQRQVETPRDGERGQQSGSQSAGEQRGQQRPPQQQQQQQQGRPQSGRGQPGQQRPPQEQQQQQGRLQSGRGQPGQQSQQQEQQDRPQGAWGQPGQQRPPQQQQQQGKPQSGRGQPGQQSQQQQQQDRPQGAWEQPGQQRPPQQQQPKDVTTQMQELNIGSSSAAVKSTSPRSTVKKEIVSPTDKKKVPEHEKIRLMSLIPKRKNPLQAGKAGRPIRVMTNMIKLIFKSNFALSVAHYDIKFDPDRPKYIRKLAFFALRNTKFPNSWPAFDGVVNVYSAGDLPFGRSLFHEVEFFDEEWQKNRTVKITMEKVNEIDMSWLHGVRPGFNESEHHKTTIQALDVILRMVPYNRAIMVGRSFFPPLTSPGLDLSDGMELWVGMFQSAVLGWKPYFNVDVAHKAFPKSENVIEVMKDLCADRYGNKPNDTTLDNELQRNYRKIEQYFKELKVIYQLPNQPSSKRTVGVNGLDKPAVTATFTLDNGEVTTVDKYFAGSKRYKIRFPNLPCLWVGAKNKKILVPPELCKIAPGNVTNRKLNEEQTRRMIRESATPPATRMQRILDNFRQMRFNEDPTLAQFGLSLGGEFETVNARVLAPPTLQYATRQAQVNKGVWRSPGAFLKASEIPPNQWTILNLCDRMNDNTLYKMVESLIYNGRDCGMNIGEPKTPFEKLQPPVRNTQQLSTYFEKKKKEGVKLVLVVIPGRGLDVYPKVKQEAELRSGILTQCIKDNTVNKIVTKNDSATTGNILLKINSKMNGINHTITDATRPQCLKSPTIIFGADVTHPSPDAMDIPSIAAVAASHSKDVFKYNIMIRLQPPRQEIIIHLEEITIEQLRIFEKNAGTKPVKIFFYRDGVSEGQFPQVMHFELQALRNACRKFGGPQYEPKITFLVVQKRHHIRLFPTDRKNSDDRNGNVQAGTIVDTEITHPSHIDFYLVSHASIQGTARPTKYRCLWDDNDMSEDEIEQLTYYLCHMFSRCNRSVSYPAPTYYAHLAAFRARALTSGVNIQLNNLDRAQLTSLTLKPELVNNNPMFFV